MGHSEDDAVRKICQKMKAEFHLSCKMQLLIYEYKKKNAKIPSEN